MAMVPYDTSRRAQRLGDGGRLLGPSPSDPITFAVVPLVLALVGAAATWLPARGAAPLDPMNALWSN